MTIQTLRHACIKEGTQGYRIEGDQHGPELSQKISLLVILKGYTGNAHHASTRRDYSACLLMCLSSIRSDKSSSRLTTVGPTNIMTVGTATMP
jgi:cephalosporin-C deacetylase-like acetyl esterase